MPENLDTQTFVNWFRNSSPYINAHRGRTFVIYFGGSAVANPQFASIVHDFSLLHSLGVKLVLVHGAREQIDQRLAQANLETRFDEGIRVTDEKALPLVTEAVGRVRVEIEALLSMGLANSPMAGARMRVVSGNLVTARPRGVHNGVDFKHTGEVRRVDIEAIQKQLEERNVVLLSPLGYSPTGEVFSIKAFDVATHVAIALKADKFICMSKSSRIRDDDGALLPQLSISEAEHYLKNCTTPEPFLQGGITACKNGVRRVHFIDREQEGSLLLELFTRDGAGTLITSEAYDTLRQATIEDAGGVLELIAPLEQAGILVRRSRERLEMEISHFTIMERDGTIIACSALYPYAENNVAELACLAVHQDYQNQGRGETMLEIAEKQARQLGVQKLFVLTARTAHWFLERGFVEATLDDLPVRRQAMYNYQRKSKVFIKSLQSGRREAT